MRKLELYVLLFGIVLCSFVLSPYVCDQSLTTRHVVWCIITIVLCVLASLKIINRQIGIEILRYKIFWLFGGFILASILSMIYAINLSEGLYEILRTIMMFVYFFLVATIIDKDKIVKTFTLVGVAFGVLGAIGWYGWVGTEEPGSTPLECIGTMCNRNLWCSAQLLILPFCVYSAVKYGRFWKVLGVVGSLGITFTIFALFARSSVLGWAVIVAVVFLLDKRTRKYTISALCLGAICIYLLTLLPNRYEIITCTDSMSQRTQIWWRTFLMLKDHPLGIGAGNWRITIPLYVKTITTKNAFVEIFFQRPHNDFLWSLSETGIWGGLCYVGMFIAAFYYAIKAKSVLIISCLAAFMTVMCFSFMRERPFHQMYLMILFALAVSGYHKIDRRMPRMLLKPNVAYLVSILILGILVVGLYDFSMRYRGECFERKIKFARDPGPILLNEPTNYTWFKSLSTTSMPMYWYSGMANFHNERMDYAISDFKKACKANPNHVFVLNNLGSCLATQGKMKEAAECYERALSIRSVENIENNYINLLESGLLPIF